MIVLPIVLMAAAFVLLELGRWGRCHAEALVPRALSATGRAHQVVVLRRGAATCQLVGVLAVIAASVVALSSPAA